MDILKLHFSKIDFDKPDQSKAVIRRFLLAESDLDTGDENDTTVNDLVDLIFLAYQHGHSAGYAAGADFVDPGFD